MKAPERTSAIVRRAVAAMMTAAMILGTSCAITTKPCSSRGDVGWVPEVKGDQICYQQVRKDGTFVNHGAYKRMHRNGKIALEGQFVNGYKQGIWIQYDENGKKVRERYFEKGVEKTVAMTQEPKAPESARPSGDSPR